MLDLNNPIYRDETEARTFLEGIRWAKGAYCPNCGGMDKVKKLGGAAAAKGLWHCGDCRKKFSVTVGTVFERSHIPLTKWLAAFHLMCSSKKGISAHQGHRLLDVTYKTAWFMWHRIREAMKRGGLDAVPPMGGAGAEIEADETFFGRKPGTTPHRGVPEHKLAIFSLVERGGEVRSFHIDRATAGNIKPIIDQHVNKASTLNTDEAKRYVGIGREFDRHEAVNHRQDEYVRGTAYTNTIEGYFSIFKKGMKGVYQHCDERHLHRYLAEFDFRYSNRASRGVDDNARTREALRGVSGKRLTYNQAR